jgi:hypothetical protein
MFENTIEIEKKTEKNFTHTNRAISMLFLSASQRPKQHHLLYQLPTRKTVIFSEIVRYLSKHDLKVVVLTHRIELCKQTLKMLKVLE